MVKNGENVGFLGHVYRKNQIFTNISENMPVKNEILACQKWSKFRFFRKNIFLTKISKNKPVEKTPKNGQKWSKMVKKWSKSVKTYIIGLINVDTDLWIT